MAYLDYPMKVLKCLTRERSAARIFQIGLLLVDTKMFEAGGGSGRTPRLPQERVGLDASLKERPAVVDSSETLQQARLRARLAILHHQEHYNKYSQQIEYDILATC